MILNGLGFSIDYRKWQKDWPKPYRLRIITNKNQRAEYRLTVYGDSLEEAIHEGELAIKKATADFWESHGDAKGNG